MANTISVTVLAETQAMRKGIDQANAKLGTLNKTAKSAGPTLKGVLGANLITSGLGAAVSGLRAFGGVLSDSVAEARESQKVGATTAQIIKATGGAAKVSATDVGNLATAISNKTGVDDEAIQSGANLLLTFKNVRNEAGAGSKVFDRATAAAADLSAAGFGSIEGSSKTLGKALNDPVKGISALGRAGVTFTAGQKKQIATLVKSGDTLKAQKIILGEVESQVGGVAAANATAGEKAKVMAGNLKEQFGTTLLPLIDKAATFFTNTLGPAISNAMSNAGPAFDKVKTAVAPVVAQVTPLVASFRDHLPQAISAAKTAFSGIVAVLQNPVFQSVAAGVLAIVAAFRIYQTVMTIVRAATAAFAIVQGVLNVVMAANPIGIVVLAIIGLVAAFVVAYKKSETFRAVVNGALTAVKTVALAVWSAIKTAAAAVWKAIQVVVKVVVAVVKAYITGVKTVAVGVWNAIKAAAGVVWSAIKATISNVINGVKTIITTVKTTASNVWTAIKTAASNAFDGVKTAVSNAIASAKAKFDEIKSKASDILSSVKSTFSPTALYSAGSDMIAGLVSGIGGAIGSVIQKAKDVANAAVNAAKDALGIASPSKVFRELGAFVGKGFVQGIDGTKSEVKRALSDLGKKATAAYKKDAISHGQLVRIRKVLARYDDKLLRNADRQATKAAALVKVQKRLSDLVKARSDYAASVKGSAISYANITGIEAPENVTKTSAILVQGLRDRLNAITNFNKRLAALKKAGLNKTTYDQIVAAGVEGGTETANALLKGGKSAVSQVNSLQGKINKEAGALGTATSKTMYDAGIKAAQGLIKGLKADQKGLEKAADSIAKILTKKVKAALKIKSPSKVFQGIGDNVTRGLVVGLDEKAVKAAGTAVAGSLVSGFGLPQLDAQAVAQSRAGSSVTYAITVNAPVGSSSAEIGRTLTNHIREFERVGGRR